MTEENRLSYDEMCKLIGELYLTAYSQKLEAKTVLNHQAQEIERLREEILRLKGNRE